MKVSAIQMVSGDGYQANLAFAEEHIRESAALGSDLVVLPEYCLRYGNTLCPSSKEQERFVDDMSRLARRYDVWLVAGTYPLQNEPTSKPFAATLVFNNVGDVVAQYNKINLFDAEVISGKERYRESDVYKPGNQLVIVNSPWGKIGVAVCFDLRFPNMFAEFAIAGCNLIIIPAAFTNTTGMAHWEVLVRARAIETQAFVVAVNQGGLHFNGTETWGGTMIVNPWGEIQAYMKKGEGRLIENLDLSLVTQTRQKIPLKHHNRCSIDVVEYNV